MGTPWLVVSGRPLESTRTRSSGPTVGLKLICGLPLPTFADPWLSVMVLAPISGSDGSTAWPVAGRAAAAPNSVGLAALKANAAATASVPAILAVSKSLTSVGPTLREGPLIVARDELRDASAKALAGRLALGVDSGFLRDFFF